MRRLVNTDALSKVKFTSDMEQPCVTSDMSATTDISSVLLCVSFI